MSSRCHAVLAQGDAIVLHALPSALGLLVVTGDASWYSLACIAFSSEAALGSHCPSLLLALQCLRVDQRFTSCL